MSSEVPYSNAPYSPPNSSLSVVSLVLGILGLTFLPVIGSIAAVITGAMAKKEIRASRGAVAGEGLATAGIVMGWIGIALGVISLCVLIVAVALPLLLVFLGISTDSSSMLPLLALV
ncbi:MAG: DUF4190 domain-containing protein [Anaerolineales bacterium]|nr:DUF4190 domain-containing protein [Anaerolineales bacterium]